MRCFIALKIPGGMRKKILVIQKLLLESGVFEGKLTSFENIHLTLKFLGEIDEDAVEKITDGLEKIMWNSFNGEIESGGVFSEDEIRIIWLKLNGADELQKNIDEALKSFFEIEKRFMSHVTIARVKKVFKKDKLMKLVKDIKLKNMNFKVNSFYLMESKLTKKGPKYEVIKEFKSDG